MPFRSKAQEKWMWVNKPDLAKEWQAATPKNAKLPEKMKKPQRLPRTRMPKHGQP